MTPQAEILPLLQGLDKAEYDVRCLDDEIRVDRQCVNLLRHLYHDLTAHGGKSPQDAGELCHGADYFLREFIVGDRRQNLFTIAALRVRQFAGHWYIIRTPEPNLKELRGILEGTMEFYRFLTRQGLVSRSFAEEIADQCQEFEYYQQRIDDFWAIVDDGFDTWRQACPLEPVAY
jgi:hypothetical protein